MDKTFSSYRIEERSYVAYIKREIHLALASAKFSNLRAGQIDIIVSELASNLIKHAQGGEFLYRIYDVDEEDSVFEILSIDNGSGIADPMRMMKDGVSTTNTLGQGLGAISRLSDYFQLYSLPKWGTVIYAMASTNRQKFSKRQEAYADIRSLLVNKPPEVVSGDGFKIKRKDHCVQVFVGDGLGHGDHAHEAIKRACEAFSQCNEDDPVEILRFVHEKVRRTRGLVAAIAVLDIKDKKWRICGVGNIMVRLYSGISFKSYLAYNGTLGMNIPTSIHESVFEAEKNQYLMLCSDGIRTRYDISKYPSILKYDMMVLAGAVYKDYTRRTDDSSIVIVKVNDLLSTTIS